MVSSPILSIIHIETIDMIMLNLTITDKDYNVTSKQTLSLS